ncbi:hypothetical protein GGI20_003012 [Coemansia sp. BCRC 34301]|nr:hypothetical protein GGI20_003012 [Coemansia sp. BCRC 34301]
MLFYDLAGNAVVYPNLKYLLVYLNVATQSTDLALVPNIVPLASLTCLKLHLKYPFADDVLFRGNSATLEDLKIHLDTATATMLSKSPAFNSKFEWLREQKPQYYVKAVLSCSIASTLLFIESVRVHIGTLYFQILLTTALAHGGMTVGANLELQVQQLVLGVVVSSYVLIVQACIYGLANMSSINFVLAAKLMQAFSLAIFAFCVALVYTYIPRLSLPMKINAVQVYLAMTRYPVSRQFTAATLPGFMYAQLIGAAISTMVNIFVMPSTSSRKLVGSFRALVQQMSECCEFFEASAAALGQKGQQSSDGALGMRLALRTRAESFGQAVGGSRYETTVERFSQLDYQQIFTVTDRLSRSFGTMCLPFEIDDNFYRHLDDPSTKMQHGRMTSRSPSMVSVGSSNCSEARSARRHRHQQHRRFNSDSKMHHDNHPSSSHFQVERSLANLAEMHRRQELRAAGMKQALGPIKAQVALHRQVLTELLERTRDMEHGSPTKSLFHLVASSLRLYTAKHPTDPGYLSLESCNCADVSVCNCMSNADICAGQLSKRLREQLAQLSLNQMAAAVEQHIELFEQAELACIQMIAPYNRSDNVLAGEQHVIVLSFVGALRENAVHLCSLLRTLHQVNEKRPNRIQIWFPKLSWSWLYRGRVDEDNDEDMEPETDNWDLENAFDMDSGAESISSTSANEMPAGENGTSCAESQLPPSRFGEGGGLDSDNESSSHGQQLGNAVAASNSPATPRRHWGRHSHDHHLLRSQQERQSPPKQQALLGSRLSLQQDALSSTRRHLAARAAGVALDWARRPKTKYALKFTITIMAWAIWSFFGFSEDFFRLINGSWGLTCIGAMFGITVGSTVIAGLTRVLGVSLSGAWAIVAWQASRSGETPYAACFCCVVYFAASYYLIFFIPRLAQAGPAMLISFTSVLFTAYGQGRASEGTSLGWKHVAVNVVAIVFAFVVSALFMPYKARTALRRRLSEVFHLNSLTIQAINYMHIARADFPTVHANERIRVDNYIARSRILISKCRGLLRPAAREPSVHERFQALAHQRLIDTLELQLEWLMYSFFTHSSHTADSLSQVIRQVLAMREDIIGAKTTFNSILASALYAKTRLPPYLPDIGTARHQFIDHLHPLMPEEYCRSLDITYLSRWNVGILHVIASQADLCIAVRAIVGAETDMWPEEVGFMLDCIEMMPLGQVANGFSGEKDVSVLPHHKGQWFSRLPKYYPLASSESQQM